jgi:mannose-6-phosphate isomerase
MANSDNVLRAGLTPKHIDVPELMKHTLFESIVPNVMPGNEVLPGERVYPCPVPDFGIAMVVLSASLSYTQQADSLEIWVVTEGGALINNALVLKKGEAFAVLAGASYRIQASGQCTLFKAFVPHA